MNIIIIIQYKTSTKETITEVVTLHSLILKQQLTNCLNKRLKQKAIIQI